MADIDELISRLEQASEGSRELDRLIHNAICEAWRRLSPEEEPFAKWVPNYTTGIEAALTLLPAWASYELTNSAAGPPTFTRVRLWDWRRSPLMSDPGNEWKSEGNRPLPINMVIAALRARAHQHGREGE